MHLHDLVVQGWPVDVLSPEKEGCRAKAPQHDEEGRARDGQGAPKLPQGCSDGQCNPQSVANGNEIEKEVKADG